MKKMTVEATLGKIKPVTDFINAQLEELGCSQRIRIQVDVAVDEIFGNIISFIDHGVPYDPLSAEFVDTTHLSAKERPIGGLGLFLVKNTMDEISYRYQDGQNILTIRKKI